MNSFFGIGILELFFIMVIALLVLGPERLPGAIKEVAKYIRYFRNLSSELMSQFNEQFGDDLRELEDLHPQKLINEFIGEDEEPKKTTKSATTSKPATKPKTTSTTKSSTATKTTTTAKTSTTNTTNGTQNNEKLSDDNEKVAENGASATDLSVADKTMTKKSDSTTVDVTKPEESSEKLPVDSSEEPQPVIENRILPPPLDKKASGAPMGSIPEEYKRNKAPKETKAEDTVADPAEVTVASVSTDSLPTNGTSPTNETDV